MLRLVHALRDRLATKPPRASRPIHCLQVDHSEGRSALLAAVHACGEFDVRMGRLATGDYLIDDEVLVERKTVVDFAASLVDGRH
jgi:ERCC4-type nuclease